MTTAAPASAPATGHRHGEHHKLALLVIASAQLMVVLDATIVNIALPHIRAALHFSTVAQLSWVLSSYTLVFGGLLLLGGRSGDLFGRRRMFMIGVSLFAAASLAGGFAWDKGWLFAMRALQGVGGAIASPTALSLVSTTFPAGRERNRAFGVYAAVSGAGAAIGLILGGVLTDYLSWRWVLFVNAPIGATLAIAAPFVLDESTRNAGRFALTDALTSTLGMLALVYAFIHAAPPNGWSNLRSLLAFGIALVLLATFVLMQSRRQQPLMPLSLFANSTRNGAYLVMLIAGASVFAMFFFLTQYVQNVLGFSPIKAGLAFLPVSATIVVTAQVVSRLVSHVPPKTFIASGTVFAGLGLFSLSRLTVHSSYAGHVLPSIIMIALGMGSIFVPITLAAVNDVRQQDSGIASAMLNVGQQVGGSLGVASLATIAAHASGSRLDPVSYTQGADAAFRAGSIFMLVGLAAALFLVRARPSGSETVAAPPA